MCAFEVTVSIMEVPKGIDAFASFKSKNRWQTREVTPHHRESRTETQDRSSACGFFLHDFDSLPDSRTAGRLVENTEELPVETI